MIRDDIDMVVNDINDCIFGGVDEDEENNFESVMINMIKTEVVDEDGPFTDEEVNYIFNHVVVDGQVYDILSKVFGVDAEINITTTRKV